MGRVRGDGRLPPRPDHDHGPRLAAARALQRPDAAPLLHLGEANPGCGGEALPFSQLGGFVLGARAATMCGVPGAVAAATTVVDLTTELVAKLPYMLVGLAAFAWIRPGDRLILPILGGILLVAALAGMALALQARGVAAIERLASRIAERWSGRAARLRLGREPARYDARDLQPRERTSPAACCCISAAGC